MTGMGILFAFVHRHTTCRTSGWTVPAIKPAGSISKNYPICKSFYFESEPAGPNRAVTVLSHSVGSSRQVSKFGHRGISNLRNPHPLRLSFSVPRINLTTQVADVLT